MSQEKYTLRFQPLTDSKDVTPDNENLDITTAEVSMPGLNEDIFALNDHAYTQLVTRPDNEIAEYFYYFLRNLILEYAKEYGIEDSPQHRISLVQGHHGTAIIRYKWQDLHWLGDQMNFIGNSFWEQAAFQAKKCFSSCPDGYHYGSLGNGLNALLSLDKIYASEGAIPVVNGKWKTKSDKIFEYSIMPEGVNSHNSRQFAIKTSPHDPDTTFQAPTAYFKSVIK